MKSTETEKALRSEPGAWMRVIREFRREFGLTQAQLAQESGVSCPAIQKYERSLVMPDSKQADKLLEFMHDFVEEDGRYEENMREQSFNAEQENRFGDGSW